MIEYKMRIFPRKFYNHVSKEHIDLRYETSKHALRRGRRYIVVKNAAELPGIAVEVIVIVCLVFWNWWRWAAPRFLQTLRQTT